MTETEVVHQYTTMLGTFWVDCDEKDLDAYKAKGYKVRTLFTYTNPKVIEENK